MLRIEAIFFDIGETILDRTREYAAWARALGIPPHTFSAVFGALTDQGASVDDVIRFFAPGIEVPAERRRLQAIGALPELAEVDLYPDARTSLDALAGLGLHVGVVGNQPRELGAQLRNLDLPARTVAVSAEWGVAKPSPEFFARIAAAADAPAERIVYVGDQLRHDILPAQAAGLGAIRIVRGPWGYLQRDPDIEAGCLAVVTSLGQVVAWAEKNAQISVAPDAATPSVAEPGQA